MENYIYNLGQHFSKIASKNNNIAVDEFEIKNKYSFEYLELISNKISHLLLDQSLTRGDCIAIFNKKNVFGYGLMIASLKIGVTYVNLDKNMPTQRINKILDQLKPKMIFDDFSSPSIKEYKNTKINYLINQENISNLDKYSSEFPIQNKNVSGESLAYIMFTSGSTGSPKGVSISHKSVLNFIHWSRNNFNIKDKDRITNINPLFFDNSVFDFYGSLFNGATILPIHEDLLLEPLKLIKYIDSKNASIWFSVPSLLVYGIKMRAFNSSQLKNLRQLIFGGEAFPKSSLRLLANIFFPRIELINVYGPTECTCICSSYKVKKSDLIEDKILPLGEISNNIDYYLLDNNNNLINDERIGELYLGGENIAKGYYNDINSTKKSFIQSHKHNKYIQLFYKTGDLVIKHQNQLNFIGRKDNQIKRMGYRIELEEIEFALNSVDYISESAVISITENDIIKIIAIVDSNVENKISIIQNLRCKLPKYMLPDDIIFMKNILKNNNGKINRKLLKSKLEK